MIKSSPPQKDCKIVVGLKATSDASSTIKAATVLAKAIEAEMVGLFVQEDAMIDLANLPFSAAIGHGETKPTSLTPEAMATAISRKASTCLRLLEAHANKASIKWSFTKEQGEFLGQTNNFLDTGDFLVLPGNGDSLSKHHLIDDLNSASNDVRGIVIASRHLSSTANGPVIVLDDGSQNSEEIVTLASCISKVTGAPLHLFILVDRKEDASRIENRSRKIIGPDLTVIPHHFLYASVDLICTAAARFTPSFVVANSKSHLLDNDQAVIDLLRAAKAPIILLK